MSLQEECFVYLVGLLQLSSEDICQPGCPCRHSPYLSPFSPFLPERGFFSVRTYLSTEKAFADHCWGGGGVHLMAHGHMALFWGEARVLDSPEWGPLRWGQGRWKAQRTTWGEIWSQKAGFPDSHLMVMPFSFECVSTGRVNWNPGNCNVEASSLILGGTGTLPRRNQWGPQGGVPSKTVGRGGEVPLELSSTLQLASGNLQFTVSQWHHNTLYHLFPF